MNVPNYVTNALLREWLAETVALCKPAQINRTPSIRAANASGERTNRPFRLRDQCVRIDSPDHLHELFSDECESWNSIDHQRSQPLANLESDHWRQDCCVHRRL